jgi:O-methyltransferase
MATLLGRRQDPDFFGWGMITHTCTPWHNGGGDDMARAYLRASRELSDKVKQGDFKLTQFGAIGLDQVLDDILHQLMWRHYIVFWSACYASRSTVCPRKNLVECGVCDGMTAFFAMRAARLTSQCKAFLYDAWTAMKTEDLLDSEKRNAGAYGYLDLENTKRNLIEFQHDTAFIKGRIPDSFKTSDNPTEVVWIHIDLNSSLPTAAALQFFFDRIVPGGVVLLDDYAGHGYEDTKLAVDQFFSGKNGVLFPLPTGQAIFFKH